MAQQLIQLGSSVNDGQGDPLRTAFTKVNANFTELYSTLSADFSGLATVATSGSYTDLINKPTIPTDINQLADSSHLLGQGGANTGTITFSGNSLQANSASQVGYKLTITSDYNGNNYPSNGNGVQVALNTANINLVQPGWTITLADGHSETVSASYSWQNSFWVIGWNNNYNTNGANIYPIVVQSPDYQAGYAADLTTKGVSNNVVGSNFAQLQWTTPTGLAETDPNGTHELVNWAYVDSGGVHLEVNINGQPGTYGGLHLMSTSGKVRGPDTNGTPTVLVEGNLDVTRNIVSTLEYTNSNPQMAHNAICTSIEAGVLYSYAVGFGTSPNYWNEQRTNVLLTKTDYKGNFVWQMLYDLSSDGDLDLYGDAMSVVSDGNNITICGSATPYNGGTAVGFLLKVDTSGNIISTKLLSAGANQNFIADDVKLLSTGEPVVSGYIENGIETWLTGITPSTGSQVDQIVFPRGDIARDLITDSYAKAVGADSTSTDVSIGSWINATVQTVTGDANGAVLIVSTDYNNGVYGYNGASNYGSGYDVYGRYKIAGSLLGGVDGGYEFSANVSNASGTTYQFLSADYPTLGTTVQVGWYAGISSTHSGQGTNTDKTSKITAVSEVDGVVTITTQFDIGATGNVDFFSGNDVTFRNLLNWNALYQWADVIGAACTDYIAGRNIGSNVDFTANAPYNIIKVTYTDAVIHTNEWTKTYNGITYDFFRSVTVDSLDNIYTCGQISTTDYKNTAIITKLNSAGEVIWTIRPNDIGGDTNRGYWNQYLSLQIDPYQNTLIAFGNNNWGELVALKINANTGEILTSKHLAQFSGWVMGSARDENNNLFVLLDNNRTLLKLSSDLALAWQRNLVGPSYIAWQYAWSGNSNLAASAGVVFQSGIYNNKSIVITYPADGNMIGQGDDWYWHNTIGSGTWEDTTISSTPVSIDIQSPTVTTANPQWPPVVIGTTATTLYPVVSVGLHGGIGGELTGVKDIVFEDGTVLSTAGVPDSTYVSPNGGITHTITTYNGGTQFNYTGSQVRWFDPTNVANVKQHGHLTGYIVEYQAYDSQSYGVTIGTIHYSAFYGWQSGQEATHTEHMSSDRANINNNKFWVTDGNSALAFLSDNRTTTITIQWTAKLFWGEENNC